MRYVLSVRPEKKVKPVTTDCFSIINVPVTDLKPIDIDYDDILSENNVECIAFTSSYGAHLFFIKARNKAFRYFGIGKTTCEEVERNGFRCEYPERMDSEGLANLLLSRCAGRRIALIRSRSANKIVNDRLKGKAFFLDIRNYEAVPTGVDLAQYLQSDDCAGIIVTSSMEAEIALPYIRASGKPVYSIGDVTTETLESAGVHPLISGKSDFSDLVKKIKEYLCSIS
ncbi:uroporphyrinogen-III synthase [Thermoplasma sp.]|uniref:uroporphyrinogen-III synthase n=1 Tax=Thermoplasma sp. TaxID=1973142 RepID=UPI00261A4C7A|nr:uroporphyrinogen-III synthase [Thermoplasma sp.]